jgi:hypothetical protein
MTGLCVAWAVASWCEAAVLLPIVIRVFRREPQAENASGPNAG